MNAKTTGAGATGTCRIHAGQRRWRDLSRPQRVTIVVTGVAEALATAVAAADLGRRPRTEIRGPKALWWLAILVQPVGPAAYLLFGRRDRTGAAPGPGPEPFAGWDRGAPGPRADRERVAA